MDTTQPHSRSVAVVPEQQGNCWLVCNEHSNKATMNNPLNSIIDVGTAFLLGHDLPMLDKDDDTIKTTPRTHPLSGVILLSLEASGPSCFPLPRRVHAFNKEGTIEFRATRA
jgi:hypothetical protein